MLKLFFLVSAWLTSPLAFAERPIPPHEGRFHLGADVDIYHSSANFQSDGRSHTLLGGASFDHQEVDAHFDFDLNEALRAYAGLSYGITSASNGTAHTSNSGLNEISAGAQWWLYTQYAFVVPQAQITYPFWRVNEASTNALIGEGAVAAEFGGYLIWRLRPRVEPFAYSAYTYRDVGRSSLIPYAVGINWRPNRWWFEGSLRGFASATHDSGADTPGQHDVYLTRADGGSYRYAAQSPTLTDLNLQTGWRFAEGWHIYGGGSIAVAGTNMADGWDVRFGLTYTGRFFERAISSSREQGENYRDGAGGGSGDSGRSFQPNEDKYDESLFQEQKAKPKPAVRPKRKRKDPGVDKMLQETEKELQGP